MMKSFFLPGFIIGFSLTSAFSQSFMVNPSLEITPLSKNAFIHTYDNSNGLIFISGEEAIIVSTPPSDEVTLSLINWVRDSLRKDIIAYVIDRWHPDAMEGLDVVQRMHIPSYSSELTRETAANKGLPVPKTGFMLKKEIQVGNEKVICHYLGPAHTLDGIVVYVPSERILFGGNEVRSNYGWAGNIADAYLDEWSSTIRKVRDSYGDASTIIPGHGRYGGPELLDYTIDLYTHRDKDTLSQSFEIDASPAITGGMDYFLLEGDESTEEDHLVRNATLYIDKGEQYVLLRSPQILISEDDRRFESEKGRIKILNKQDGSELPETDAGYEGLSIERREDEIEMTIVVRRLIL